MQCHIAEPKHEWLQSSFWFEAECLILNEVIIDFKLSVFKIWKKYLVSSGNSE